MHNNKNCQKNRKKKQREANTHPRACGKKNKMIDGQERVAGNCRRQCGGSVGRCTTVLRLWATSQVACPVLTRNGPTGTQAGHSTVPPSSSR